jgi:transposase
MRECYGADIYCQGFYRQNEESFLEGQINGFEYFEGAPKRIIFDNAKVAVKEGFGTHAKVQDRYKALAAHYAFQCDFCNIAAGHDYPEDLVIPKFSVDLAANTLIPH